MEYSSPNISAVSDSLTARTRGSCAFSRAENLASLGVKSVLELMTGPSLRTLEQAYKSLGIMKVAGNDIDPRWKKYYSVGKWIIGDARKVDTSGYDAVVVAPPLSKGCSGKRSDSLSLDQVFPSYYDFLSLPNKIIVFVLPGRTLSLKEDRKQLYKFLSKIQCHYEIVPLVDKVVKYVDVYVVNDHV